MTMIRSILAATDLTETSDPVVGAAASLAALTGARLHLLHSFDVDTSPYWDRSGEPPTFDVRVRAAQRQLDEQVARVVRPDVDVASREVVIYIAHKAILQRAADVEADLVVLGPHRKRAVGDAFLGSTADRVIRTSEVPCLVVRGPLSLPLRRVMVPIDLSEPARAALDVALRWTGALGAATGTTGDAGPELRMLHVIPRTFDFEDFPFGEEVIGPELRRELEEARGRTGVDAPLVLREEVRWGDSPAEEIVRLAAEENMDLVVLATHGRGAVQRALVGSVASGVARAAGCPVLLVPPAVWREGV